MSHLSDCAHQDWDQLMDLQEVSNQLGVEAHFEALWKRLEFPSTLELFSPAHPTLNMHSCRSGWENSAGVRSGGVDHTLNNHDINFFNKVKSSMPETHQKADFSNPVDKNPSQDCKFWVVDGNSAPKMMYTSKALPGHHWVLIQDSTGAALMGVKPLPHCELFEHDLVMPLVSLMLMVSEPHPHKAEQLLWVVLRDIGVHFWNAAQMIIILHPFSLSAVYDQMTALLQESEQMALTLDIYLMLLAQMFVMQTMSMEQYSQLWTHIHGLELLTKSEAAATIFLQSTTGEASDKEAMSCNDEISMMLSPALKSLGSGQKLQGAALQKALAPWTPASSGWPTVLEKLFSEVPSWHSQTAVPTPHTQTHSMESRESQGSIGSKWKVYPSGESNVEPTEKQLHCSASDNAVFIMMDSTPEVVSGPAAKEPPTQSLEKVTPSSHQGWVTRSSIECSHGSSSASS